MYVGTWGQYDQHMPRSFAKEPQPHRQPLETPIQPFWGTPLEPRASSVPSASPTAHPHCCHSTQPNPRHPTSPKGGDSPWGHFGDRSSRTFQRDKSTPEAPHGACWLCVVYLIYFFLIIIIFKWPLTKFSTSLLRLPGSFQILVFTCFIRKISNALCIHFFCTLNKGREIFP